MIHQCKRFSGKVLLGMILCMMMTFSFLTTALAADPVGGIKLTKVDAYQFEPLAGAIFNVYLDADCTNVVYENAVTNDQGEAIIENLTPGDYYLMETQAAEGYLRDDTPKLVSVIADQMTPITIATQMDGLGSYREANPPYLLIILGGITILLAVAILIVIILRRKKMNEKANHPTL